VENVIYTLDFVAVEKNAQEWENLRSLLDVFLYKFLVSVVELSKNIVTVYKSLKKSSDFLEKPDFVMNCR
jgi:hypothetical protein